jgi:DNA-binding GntR family transcriptional regulator
MSKSANPLAQTIAQALERRIVLGNYTAPVALRQADVAAEFAASHIPVREAFARLAESGLVQVLPNRGAVIVPLSAAQCLELAEMRCALEALALSHAMAAHRAATWVCARAALAQSEGAQDHWDRALANWAFHDSLYADAQRPFLRQQIGALWRHATRYLVFAWAQANHVRPSDREHRALLKACQRGEPDIALALLRQHIQRGAQATARRLRELA